MAKGKYEQWRTPDGLTLLTAWKRDGLTDEQIGKKCGVTRKTIAEWKRRFGDIRDALSRGRELVDIDVENALLKKAKGYTVQVAKVFKCKTVDFDPVTGRKVRESEELKTGYEDMYIPADTRAQEFWLKNRKRTEWQDRPEPAKNPEKGRLIVTFDDQDAGEVWSG